ncbi:MAG: outer membrane beta-barrel protein [Acetobacter sp.]
MSIFTKKYWFEVEMCRSVRGLIIDFCHYFLSLLKSNFVAVGARDQKRNFLTLVFFSCVFTVNANAQIINQVFPSELPGYSADTGGSVSLREILSRSHVGIPIGAYILRPSASQGFNYNTNILGAPNTAGAEFDTAASLGVNSNWSRHAIGASVSVANTAYPTLSAANYTDWSASAGGSVNLGRDVASLGYSHQVKHLTATDLGNFGIGYPVPYAADDVRLNYRINWTRFALIPSASYDNFSFGNSEGTLPTAARDTSALGHQLETQMLRGRFEVSKGNAIVAALRSSQAQFVTRPDYLPGDYISGGGFVGVDLRADPVLQYRLLAGGETRHFTRGNGHSITTPTAEADIVWMPDKMNTVTLIGQRGLFDPTSPFSRNQVMSTVSVLWDRELRKDLIFHGSIGLARTDSHASTEGVQTREQTQSTFRGAVDWLFRRDLKLTLKYSHVSSYSKHGVASVLENTNSKSTFTGNTIGLTIAFAR